MSKADPNKSHKTPAANKKLKNIDTIKKMLDGTHWTQTKTQVSLNKSNDYEKKQIGDRWVDDMGFEWEQKDGYRVRISKLESIRSAENEKTFPKCPKAVCESASGKLSPAQQKMKAIHGMCINCVADLETKMKIRGEYHNYETNRMKENALAWLANAEAEKNEMKQLLITRPEFVNEDGTVEKWDLPYNPEELGAKMDEEFNKFKDDFLKQLEKI